MNNIGDPNLITGAQLVALNKIHDSYTVYLAGKQYKSISTNYAYYINLLAEINSINVTDPNLKILLKIATDGLQGSVNSVSLYNQYVFKEIAISELNNRISAILSMKNRQQALDTTTSTVKAVQVINFNPLFSYYISLYGMPEYGVGFDTAKLAILQNLMM